MKKFKSTLHFKTFVFTSILAMALSACGLKDNERTSVTGKGNGGNALIMSANEINSRFDDFNIKMKKLFMGLQELNEAEELIPGNSDLSEFRDLRLLIKKMTDPKNNENIFADIQTKDNLDLSDKPCVDKNGYENAGKANAGEIFGKICFSIPELRKASPKGAESATSILVLSLAAHEYSHHYMNSASPAKDEGRARTLQAFINYELHKFDQMPTEGVVSTSDFAFLDRFADQAHELYLQTQTAHALKGGN